MNRAMAWGLVLAVACGLALNALAQAPAQTTKITLTELDCMGCAKKVAKKLAAVPGVAGTRIDLPGRALHVTHQPAKAPSPRALWEAVEQCEHAVERIDTPTASYTSKPQT